MRVRKRDGRLVEFDQNKIRNAALKAIRAVYPTGEGGSTPEELVCFIPCDIEDNFRNKLRESNKDIVDISEIEDLVEFKLMEELPEVAKAYILYRQKHKDIRDRRKKFDFRQAVSDYMFASKYSKFDEILGRREVYNEIVDRNMNMHIKKFPQLEEKIREAYEYVRQKKIMPAMRSMQFAGPAIEAHNARMFNCSFTLVDRIWCFKEIFYLLLCGCGVGYSVQRQHVKKLPELSYVDDKAVKHFHVPDTIEGWSDTIGELINSYIGGYWVEFDYSSIRPRGSILKTSGGIAPGHLPLRRCVEFCRDILNNAQGRRLKTLECSDIICRIAQAVLAGGIRRSSLIAIFSYEDDDMFYAKCKPNFDPFTGHNDFRCMANFTAALLRKTVTGDQFMRIINTAQNGYGEPAFAFLEDLNYGYNPCGEAGLNPTITEEIPY